MLMEIKDKKGYFLVKNKKSAVALVFDDNNLKIDDDLDLVVNRKLENIFSVTSPGEYEVNEIFVMAFDKSGKRAYLINLDGVNILFTDSTIDFTEKDLDELASIDILIFMDANLDVSSDIVKFVNKIDPKVWLLNKQYNKGEIAKMFATTIIDVSKKYKFSPSEFEVEEYKLSIISINND